MELRSFQKTKAACGLQQKNSGTFSAPLKAVRDKISDRRLECVARRFGKFFGSGDWWLRIFMGSDSRKLLDFWVILPTFTMHPDLWKIFTDFFSKLFPSKVSTNFLLLPSTKVSFLNPCSCQFTLLSLRDEIFLENFFLKWKLRAEAQKTFVTFASQLIFW